MADKVAKVTVEMLEWSGVRWVFGLTLCVLGLATEFRQDRIASNARWPQLPPPERHRNGRERGNHDATRAAHHEHARRSPRRLL